MSGWDYASGQTPMGNSVFNTVSKSGRVAQTRMQARILGGPQLMLALAALEVRVAVIAATEAVGAAAGVIEEEWRERVPVEDGNYRRAISTKVARTRYGAAATIAVRHLDNVVAHTDNPEREQPYLYAARLEFGSSGVLLRFGGRVRQRFNAGFPAQPSARPAFDRSKGAAVDRAAAVLRAAAYVGTY